LEDALKVGAAKNEKLKPEDFTETSIRFCVGGLSGWLEDYADEHYDGSLRRMLRDVSWQWASYCEANPGMLKVKVALSGLRNVLSETNYTNLMDELATTRWRLKELGYSGKPVNVRLPNGSSGVISRLAGPLDISFSRFFNIGLSWSLSTNNKNLYASWIEGTVAPLMAELADHCQRRLEDLADVQAKLTRRLSGGGE